MKTKPTKPLLLTVLSAICFSSSLVISLASNLRVELIRENGELLLLWEELLDPNFTPHPARTFEVQVSNNLQDWRPIGRRVRASKISPQFRLAIGSDAEVAFYRVLSFSPPVITKLASDGSEAFGFAGQFAKSLRELGDLSLPEFNNLYEAPKEYSPQITFDPSQARFWDRFATDPEPYNRGENSSGTQLNPEHPEFRATDFRLNQRELEVFNRNGFVVSERLGSGTFADLFYKLWKDDMPVFVSSDAILQAWHRTYDLMLVEMEEQVLLRELADVLTGMLAELEVLATEPQSEVMLGSIRDVDHYLGVALSLLQGRPHPGALDQNSRINQTRQWVLAEELREVPDLFGVARMVDFSQFKPRGHYLRSPRLSRYFRAMMWCGRTDMRVAGDPLDGSGARNPSPRELGSAIVMWDLLNRADLLEKWKLINTIVETFVGATDSMTPVQIDGLLSGAGVLSSSDIQGTEMITDLQDQILEGNLGIQNIRSDLFYVPLGGPPAQLPRSFTLFGQKFVPDSWAMSKLVFDSITWQGVKVGRRVPSALDVAFSVLGNNHTTPLLTQRIDDSGGHQFRDGFPIQHQLASVRDTMDSIQASGWQDNIYSNWLYMLRALSEPTTEPSYPQALRTQAWSMKTLNTQLASWTQLRHDTLLYATQSYTGIPICFFPEGFVEPRPVFWSRFVTMLDQTHSLLGGLDYNDRYRSRHLEHLERFSRVVSRLGSISRKELDREPFDEDDELFIRNLIEDVGWSQIGSGSTRTYDGWYPDLFYRPWSQRNSPEFHGFDGSDKADFLVADVHTNPPCGLCDDPGSVLHQGVGFVNLLLIIVDIGEGPTMFAGPVLSHFEFEVIGSPRRLSNPEFMDLVWESRFSGSNSLGINLTQPAWTADYLVPFR